MSDDSLQFQHRTYSIQIIDSKEFSVKVTPAATMRHSPKGRFESSSYYLYAGEKTIYRANTAFGRCFALSADQALADAKSMIDSNLDDMNSPL